MLLDARSSLSLDSCGCDTCFTSSYSGASSGWTWRNACGEGRDDARCRQSTPMLKRAGAADARAMWGHGKRRVAWVKEAPVLRRRQRAREHASLLLSLVFGV
jgi:hypothetical protein